MNIRNARFRGESALYIKTTREVNGTHVLPKGCTWHKLGKRKRHHVKRNIHHSRKYGTIVFYTHIHACQHAQTSTCAHLFIFAPTRAPSCIRCFGFLAFLIFSTAFGSVSGPCKNRQFLPNTFPKKNINRRKGCHEHASHELRLRYYNGLWGPSCRQSGVQFIVGAREWRVGWEGGGGGGYS